MDRNGRPDNDTQIDQTRSATEPSVAERVKARAQSLQQAGIPVQAAAAVAGLVLVVGAGFSAAHVGDTGPFAQKAEANISTMQPVTAPVEPQPSEVPAADAALSQAETVAAKKLRQLKTARTAAVAAAPVPYTKARDRAKADARTFWDDAESKDRDVKEYQRQADNWAVTLRLLGNRAYTAKKESCLSANQVDVGGMGGNVNGALPKNPDRTTQVQVNKKCRGEAKKEAAAAVKKENDEEWPKLVTAKNVAAAAAATARTNAETEDGKASTAQEAAKAAPGKIPAVVDPTVADTKPARDQLQSAINRDTENRQRFDQETATYAERLTEAETTRNQGRVYDNGLHAILWILSGAAFLLGLWLLVVLARVWPRPEDDDPEGRFPGSGDQQNPVTVPIPVMRESAL